MTKLQPRGRNEQTILPLAPLRNARVTLTRLSEGRVKFSLQGEIWCDGEDSNSSDSSDKGGEKDMAGVWLVFRDDKGGEVKSVEGHTGPLPKPGENIFFSGEGKFVISNRTWMTSTDEWHGLVCEITMKREENKNV